MHFLNPGFYPIYDSNIYTAVFGGTGHWYKVNLIERYFEYHKLLHNLISDECFQTDVRIPVCNELERFLKKNMIISEASEYSDIRIAELALYYGS